MNLSNSDQSEVQPIVFWVIWLAILAGLFILMFVTGGGFPEGANEGPAPTGIVVACGGLALVSMVVRFVAIPRLKRLPALLPAMIIGLAFSEAIGIIAMFVLGGEFPETQKALFVVSVSCVIVHAPVYVNALLQRQEMR